MNYNIPDLKFIYFYAPGLGAVVISDNKFPGAVEQKDAFNGHTLTVKVAGDHVMQLYSDDTLLSKRGTAGKVSKENKKAESAFVVYNAAFTMPTKFPVVGYGVKPDAPYVWPGSRLNVTTKGIEADAPPVPTVLTPKLSANPCPTGQVLINAAARPAEGWLARAARAEGNSAAQVRPAQGRAAGTGEVHPARPAPALLSEFLEGAGADRGPRRTPLFAGVVQAPVMKP